MKIQTLISTMNLKDAKKLTSEMNVSGDFVIVNQTSGIKYQESGTNKKVVDVDEKGLSKSRNLALEKCENKIGLIADDDIEYLDGYEETIKAGFEKYKDADAIAFYLDSDDEKNKKAKLKPGRIRGMKIFKIASCQLAFKVDSLKKNDIKFDEDFGAGAKYFMGEENILLSDMKRKGLKIYSYPVKIGTVREKRESTWFEKYDEKYFKSRGAGYYRMSKILCPFYITQFAIRKRKLFGGLSVLNAIKYMHRGVREYKKEKRAKTILFVGDFKSNNGPSNANRAFVSAVGKDAIILKHNNKLLRALELFFKMKKVGVVCFCSFSKLNVIGIKMAKRANKRTAYIVHGCVQFEQKVDGQINDDMQKTERYVFENVDKIICVSKQQSEIVKKYANRNDVSIVYNVMKNKLEKTSDIGKEENTIISTGGDWKIKNNLVVCEALAKLKQENEINIEYVIAGNVSNPDAFKKYDFVKLTGKIPQEKIIDLYKRSKLFVQNSIFDSFPLSVMEALECGCSVLISKNVGTKEILNLEDGDVVLDIDNTEEIKEKVINILSNENNSRIVRTVKWNEVSPKSVSENLKEVLYNINKDTK